MDNKKKKGLREIIFGVIILFFGIRVVFFPSVINGLIGNLSLIVGTTLLIIGFKNYFHRVDRDLISDKKGNGWLWTLLGVLFLLAALVVRLVSEHNCKVDPFMFCGLGSVITMAILLAIGIFILLIRLISRKSKKHV